MKKYTDLDELIQNDAEAKSYYEKLPEYVREQMSQRKQGINSFNSLRDYADNLTRGDN